MFYSIFYEPINKHSTLFLVLSLSIKLFFDYFNIFKAANLTSFYSSIIIRKYKQKKKNV